MGYRAAILVALLAFSGCAQVSQVHWTRLDGAPCLTTHVKPTFYIGETETECVEDGKPVVVATNHTDFSMIAYPFAALLPLIAVGL